MVPLGHSLAALKVLPGIQTPPVPAAPITPVAWQVELVLAQSVAATNWPAASTEAGIHTSTQASSPGAAPKQTPETSLPSWLKLHGEPKLLRSN